MIRRMLAALVCTVFLAGVASAEDLKYKITKLDADKAMLSVKDDKDKEKAYKLADTVKFLDADGKELKDGIKSEMLKEGAAVVVTTEGKGKKAMVKTIQLAGSK